MVHHDTATLQMPHIEEERMTKKANIAITGLKLLSRGDATGAHRPLQVLVYVDGSLRDAHESATLAGQLDWRYGQEP